MNVDELRGELDELAGPRVVPTDAEVDQFAGGLRRARRHRHGALTGGALVMVVLVVVVVVTTVSSTRGPRIEAPARGTAAPIPRSADAPSARLYLPNRTLEPGTDARAAVVVDNRTGYRISFGHCGGPFGAVLGNGVIQQTFGRLKCLQTGTLPMGRSTYPVAVRTTYDTCGGEPLVRPCALPNGAYNLTIANLADGVTLDTPKALRVQIAHTECASTGASVRVPDVTGMSIERAIRAVKAAGLHVVNAGVPDDDPVTPTARVYVQEPGAGDRIPRGACIGFRTR